jgi:arsenate reductase
METILYGIPNCDTVRKARAWLTAHDIAHSFHDFKKNGLSRELVAGWLAQLPWEAMVNQRGTTWRGLPPEQRAGVTDGDSAIALMLASPSVIKRPVLATGNGYHVGFSPQQYEQLFGAQAAG